MQLELAGRGLGEIQDIVDQRQQVPTRAMHVMGIFAVAGMPQRSQHLGAQHFGKADDGIQRRAQLMAHQGEEIALGGVGAGFGLQGPRKLLFARLQQPDLALQQRLAGAHAPIAAAPGDHEAFHQRLGVFFQQGGAQFGDRHIGIHHQRRAVGELENGFAAEQLGHILARIAGKEDKAAHQAQHRTGAAVQHGNGRHRRIGQKPLEGFTTGGVFGMRGNTGRQLSRRLVALHRGCHVIFSRLLMPES